MSSHRDSPSVSPPGTAFPCTFAYAEGSNEPWVQHAIQSISGGCAKEVSLDDKPDFVVFSRGCPRWEAHLKMLEDTEDLQTAAPGIAKSTLNTEVELPLPAPQGKNNSERKMNLLDNQGKPLRKRVENETIFPGSRLESDLALPAGSLPPSGAGSSTAPVARQRVSSLPLEFHHFHPSKTDDVQAERFQ